MSILTQITSNQFRNKLNVFTSNIHFYRWHFKDDNIFFTALIAFTLKGLKSDFTIDEQKTITQLLKDSQKAFTSFRNKDQKLSYNFYTTQPVNQYSGIPFLNKFTAIRVPDDLDDTALIYLTNPKIETKSALKIKDSFEQLSEKSISSIPKKYRSTKAYRSWFATKMKNDIDVCVLCNVLIWNFENKLKLSKVDLDSILLISNLITENKLLKQAYIFAPHYKNKAIVLYHVVRCLELTKYVELCKHKHTLIKNCFALLKTVKHPLEKIILHTSLYKLGHATKFNLHFSTKDINSFYWFKANPFSITKPWIKTLFSRKNFLHLQYQCTPYNWVLILELEKKSGATVKISQSDIQILKA